MADNFGLKIGLEGEKEFKRSLSEINQSFKVLGSEMKLVSSQFDKNDKSAEALTARNTVLNKEIEAQKQKIETLRAALQNAAESFGENDKRTQAWQIQLNNAEAALNDMEREVANNEQAIDELSATEGDAEKDTDDFADSVEDSGKTADEAGGKFEKFKDVVGNVAKATAAAVAAIGAAAVAAGKAIWDMANETASLGDEIDKESQKLQISSDLYQELSYACERCGTDISSVKKGILNITTALGNAQNGVEGAGDKFAALGVTLTNTDGSLKNTETVLLESLDALASMSDETARNAAAQEIFGKSFSELLPLLNSGSDAIADLMQEAEDYGMVMSEDAVAASATFADSLTKLKGTFTGLKNNITGNLLPSFTMIMDGLTDLIAGNEGAAEAIKEGVSNLIDSVTEMIPQIVELISTIAAAILESAPSIISALAQGILNAIPTLIPTVLAVITQLVGTLMELLPQIIEAGAQVIVSLVTGIAQALPTLIPAIVSVVVQMVQTLIDNLPMILDAALQLITGLAEGILNAIPVLIDALPEVIMGIVNFLLDAIPQIIETGIKLLTSLVEALPEIIVAIVAAIPKIIDGIINAVLNAIPLIIEAGIKLLISLIQALPQIITTIVQAIPQIISGIVNALIGNIDKIIMAGVQLFVSLIQNLPTIIVEIVKAVPQIIAGIVKAFGSLMGEIVKIGGNIVKGLWDGITGLASWLWDKVSGWISGIWDGICSFFGIHSPSKEMAWVGEMLVKGLSGSIEDNGDEAVRAAEGMAEDIDDVMTDLAHDMKTALPTEFDVTGNVKSAMDSVSGGIGGFSIALNIATFNNYSSEDIRQLTTEVMETANQFAMRKGVVFA